MPRQTSSWALKEIDTCISQGREVAVWLQAYHSGELAGLQQELYSQMGEHKHTAWRIALWAVLIAGHLVALRETTLPTWLVVSLLCAVAITLRFLHGDLGVFMYERKMNTLLLAVTLERVRRAGA